MFLGYGEPFPEISIVADQGYTFIGFEPELPESVKENIEATAQYVEKLEITNLSATQLEGTRLVDIYYDVNGGQGETVAVDLFIKIADEWIAPPTAIGDLGTGVERGADRYIVWEAESELH